MINRQLLAISLGACLSVSSVSVSAANMRNDNDGNIKRGHFSGHADVVRKHSHRYYGEPGFRYRDRHFNSSRHFQTHYRFSRHNRDYAGFLLGFGLRRHYNGGFSYPRYGYNGPGFRSRHPHRHDRHRWYRY